MPEIVWTNKKPDILNSCPCSKGENLFYGLIGNGNTTSGSPLSVKHDRGT